MEKHQATEQAPSTSGEREELAAYLRRMAFEVTGIKNNTEHPFCRAAALLSVPALPVGELTPETATALYEQAFGVKLTDSAQIGGVLRLCHLAAARTQTVREPLTESEMRDLYQQCGKEVAKLDAENRYTFAAWFPIAIRLAEKHHGIK